MMEAIANIVRAFPTDRARYGQPFVALELRHGAGPSGEMEWSIAVRCEPARRRRARRARSAPPTPTPASGTCSARRPDRAPAASASPAT